MKGRQAGRKEIKISHNFNMQKKHSKLLKEHLICFGIHVRNWEYHGEKKQTQYH